MRSRNKKGFTLLEVIIVIIILAILASIALPRLASSIAYSKSTEALQTLSAIRGSMEQCYLLNNYNYSACAGMANIGVSYTGKYFTVAITSQAGNYSVVFTGIAAGGLNPVTDRITFKSNGTTGGNVVGLTGGVFQALNQQ